MRLISTVAGIFVLGMTAARAEATPPTSSANAPFHIEITHVFGPGCADPNLVTVERNAINGEDFIDAQFYQQNGQGFAAETSGEYTTDRSWCTIQYNLILEPDYILDFAQFRVDGEYSLSELGEASMEVRYNIAGSLPEADIAFKSVRSPENRPQDYFPLAGDIEVNDSRINHCGGAVIPLEIQVHATARRGRDDRRDSYIRINNGEDHTGVQDVGSLVRCHVHVSRCGS